MKTHIVTIGQHKYLKVEYIGKPRGRGNLYQVTESFRCNEVKVGDLLEQTKVGLVAFSDIDATRPRYRIPSHSTVWSEEE